MLARWKKLASEHAIRRALSDAWGVGIGEAGIRSSCVGRKRDLTRERIEPNPGPYNCRLVSLTCGEMLGVGAAFDEWISTAKVVVLYVQELCAKESVR